MLHIQFLTSQTKCVEGVALGLLMSSAIVFHLRETFANKRTPGIREAEIQWIGSTPACYSPAEPKRSTL